MHALWSLSGLVIVVVCATGGFIGGAVAIHRYIAEPAVDLIKSIVELIREWRGVPAELRAVKDLLLEHVAQTEERLTAVEPPRIRRRKEVTL